MRRRVCVPGALAVAAAALLASGCQEPASYATRWRIVPRPADEIEPTTVDQSRVMTNPAICSQAGVSVVETYIYDELGCLVETERRPCFPTRYSNPNHLIQGLTISPGQYDLVVQGVSASGERWVDELLLEDEEVEDGEVDPNDPCFQGVAAFPRCVGTSDGPRCAPGHLVCDCRFIEVEDEKTVEIDDLVMAAPPECEDGIDGDGDGLVDGDDPGCVAAGLESTPVASAGLLFDFSLLSGNDNAVCGSIGVSRFRIRVDDNVVAEPTCRIGPFAISVGLGIGPHRIGAAAINAAGEEVTVEKVFDVEVAPSGAIDLRDLVVDFSDVDFLDPIVASAGFGLSWERYIGGPGRGCGTPNVGSLELPTVRVSILDASGAPVDPAVSGIDGTLLDGTDVECSPAAIRTDPLTWGVYQIEAEALSPEGEVCFSSAGQPEPLSPGSIEITIPRVIPPPPSCIECVAGSGNNDCNEVHTCVDGICVEN